MSTSATSPAARLLAMRETIGKQLVEPLAFLAPLATRIVLGLGFYRTGTGKLAHLDRTSEFFAAIGIPLPAANALFIGSLETVGGIALVLGLATRPFAALLSATMVVALLTADRSAFTESWSRAAEQSPTDIAAFVFLLLLLWLVFFGPGKASLDHLVVRSVARPGRTDRDTRPAPTRVGAEERNTL